MSCFEPMSTISVKNCLFSSKIVNIHAHRKQLEALERVLEKAPSGRDVGSSIERVVRFCISSKHVQVMRALPPALSEPLLKECQDMTLDFMERLFN